MRESVLFCMVSMKSQLNLWDSLSFALHSTTTKEKGIILHLNITILNQSDEKVYFYILFCNIIIFLQSNESPSSSLDQYPLFKSLIFLSACGNLKSSIKILESKTQKTLSSKHANEFETLMQKFLDIFLDDLPNGLPPSTESNHLIDLVSWAKPASKPPYRLNHTKALEVERQLAGYRRKGFEHPSSSPWASTSFLIQKKHNTMHMCIDYHDRYQIIIKNKW